MMNRERGEKCNTGICRNRKSTRRGLGTKGKEIKRR
jgi:hypothetical protein